MDPISPVEDSNVHMVYCTKCSQPMHVAEEHFKGAVSCPHCGKVFFPARMPPGPPYPGHSVPGPHPALASGVGYSWRNRWIAGALGVLLGCFGVHRFYLGYNGIGLLQAILSVGTFFALSPVVAIWGFIEGILCFCGAMRDVDGFYLSG